MGFIDTARGILGEAHVLTGPDASGYGRDFMGKYVAAPLCVLRPGSTAEVSTLLAAANDSRTPIVPISGNTGLSGGTYAEGAAMLSLARMNQIRDIREDARIAIVEAGVVLSVLHEAVQAKGLNFPLTFGARGSAMIGGALSTNAGGSNVLRYGNARALCLGLEVVLASGEVVDLMSELHKDNSGYDLRDLMIGAEGTLGVITAAVLKLVPLPRAYATAMVAVPALGDALGLLNRLQEATGGMVEAFEFMPGSYIDAHLAHFPDARPPFDARHDINLMIEIGATAPRDTTPGPDGRVPLASHLEAVLEEELAAGRVLDAVIAQNQAQRAEMWARREATAEVSLARAPQINNDIAVPLDKVETFLERMRQILPTVDPGADDTCVAHLGDGNIHYIVYPSSDEAALQDRLMERVEDVVAELGGSFSAEHGIGLTKLPSMRRRKNAAALRAMQAIKAALDPNGIMNPGKTLP
ncbi:FAD-binding oxidoreductase [Maritimibacter fusiformis]|uniref:FAD-binding oxidoreductase n=1 Tax=Maritimibacter fusiformis TaxID=2603819 RepID=A0A5D0RMC3_9RHOB|nr:FAD-binding oxidoreductase [Maritimibacter fusiformis]TYB82096.1 FAD-binding oxidoreductase [Maritimibacter fusiformis]